MLPGDAWLALESAVDRKDMELPPVSLFCVVLTAKSSQCNYNSQHFITLCQEFLLYALYGL